MGLLAVHCKGLSRPEAPTARERLDAVVGPELAHKLVLALCAGGRAHAA